MEALERASVASGRAARRIIFTFCNLLRDVRGEERKPKPWSPNNSPTLPQKVFKFFVTSPVNPNPFSVTCRTPRRSLRQLDETCRRIKSASSSNSFRTRLLNYPCT